MSQAILPSSLNSRSGWVDYLELRRDPEPHLHQIEPTNACTFDCTMCIRPTRMTRGVGYMDLGLFKRVMNEVATFTGPVRNKEIELFHFGESLLHPSLPEMVAHASGLALKPVLSLNPPALKDGLSEALLKAKPAKIFCSLDADDPELYRRLRGACADFDLAVINLERLLETKRRLESDVPVIVRMICINDNRSQAERFATRWRSAGAEVEIRPFFPWNDPALAHLGEWERLPRNMPCPFPWRYLAVQWNGDVVPCCRDCNADIVLGNLEESTLREIWNGKKYRAFREQMLSGEFENSICGPCMQLYSEP